MSLLEAQIQFGALLQVLGLPGQLALLPHPPAGIKRTEKETSPPAPGSPGQILLRIIPSAWQQLCKGRGCDPRPRRGSSLGMIPGSGCQSRTDPPAGTTSIPPQNPPRPAAGAAPRGQLLTADTPSRGNELGNLDWEFGCPLLDLGSPVWDAANPDWEIRERGRGVSTSSHTACLSSHSSTIPGGDLPKAELRGHRERHKLT